jgi:hypothetical protein
MVTNDTSVKLCRIVFEPVVGIGQTYLYSARENEAVRLTNNVNAAGLFDEQNARQLADRLQSMCVVTYVTAVRI